jgi:hypothetical protein
MPSDEDIAAVDITSQLEEDSVSPSTNSLMVDAFGGAGLSSEGSQQDSSQTGEASFLEQTFFAIQQDFVAKHPDPDALPGAANVFRLMQAAALYGHQEIFFEAHRELRRLEDAA